MSDDLGTGAALDAVGTVDAAGAMTDGGGTAQDPAEEGRQGRRRQRIEQLKAELVGGDLFSAAEVAEILDVHPRTVNDYVREGRLKAIQLGGGWKISELALRAFVRDQTQDTVQQQHLAGAGPVSPVDAGASPQPAGQTSKAAKDGRKAKYRCSFCGKSQDQVRRLIAGPNYVYICNECVALCNGIIAQQEAKGE